MKLDLWKCDRCAAKKEQPSALGWPSGWTALTIAKGGEKSPQEKHLCEACSVTFAGWASGPEHQVAVKCPDCAADLLVVHGSGDPWLKFVRHNT